MAKSFGSDNHSGIHPQILEAIVETNIGHSPSYGTDALTIEVNALFKEHFGDKAETFFVFNGTAANVLSIKTHIKSYESVLCAQDSHLNLDECGAPEAIAGSKLIPLPSPEGKI
ncbi:MAG: threonine aldolase, partial [Bdellovibrionales bacterium]|nr:threonine aldolase [Bdellovibrionales bacterium]